MNLDTIIFFLSAVVAVFGATMMVFQRNPVASVLYFILSLVAQAVLYIQLSALFLGAILVIVYAGAIMVLFLFVIMLLNLRRTEDLGEHSKPISRVTKYIVSFGLVAELVAIIKGVFIPRPAIGILGTVPDGVGDVASVARLLFTRYLFPVELTGILLLVAVVGAVVLAKKEGTGYAGTRDAGSEEQSSAITDGQVRTPPR